jgi:signal transduction histidine kinase
MLRLINDLLDVARLEGGRLQLARTPLAIRPLLQEQAALHAARAEAGEKAITVATPASLPAPAADPDLIGRVLDNLINNALKYTKQGGQIILRAGRADGALLVQVEDDGEGMAPEQAARVFDKFYQVKDGSGKARRGGAGLGLAFCKLVVEAHNGRIWAESEQGVGSTFSFTLPLAAPPHAQEEG